MNIILRTLIAATCLTLAITVFVHELNRGHLTVPSSNTASNKATPNALRLHDLVTVCVNEHPRYVSETGDVTFGEPRAYQLTARIEAIRPDGKLELKAHKTTRIDDQVWETVLTGTAFPEDFLTNNTILSERLAELSISRRSKQAIDRRSVFDHWRLLALVPCSESFASLLSQDLHP